MTSGSYLERCSSRKDLALAKGLYSTGPGIISKGNSCREK